MAMSWESGISSQAKIKGCVLSAGSPDTEGNEGEDSQQEDEGTNLVP